MPWPVDQRFIDKAIEQLGTCLPPSFIAQMRRLNGGALELDREVWELHPFWDTSDRKRASRTSNDIVRATMAAREMAWFPRNAIAIAHANTDLLVLVPVAARPGEIGEAIYRWDFHTGELEQVADDIDEAFATRQAI